MTDLYLFDIGWLFFGAYSVIVAAVALTAFASDFFPSAARSQNVGRRQFPGPSESDPRAIR